MKKSKFLFILILSIFSVSLASAQGYVDDLYYTRKNKSEREAIQKAERERAAAERTKVRKTVRVEEEETEINDDEYYPGMFADMVNGDNSNAERAGKESKESNDNKSSVTIVGLWSPSWYNYASWGSPFYDPFWYGGGFYDPFYRYGWGYNSWYGNPYYYGGWGHSWHNPHYSFGWGGHYHGHGHYYEPRYNRVNSTIGNGRRDGGTMVGTSSYGRGNSNNYTVTNQIRRMDRTTKVNSNSSSRPNTNTTNNTRPSQYNRRDTYSPPPTTTTTNRGSVGTGSGYNRGGSVGTGSGSGSGSGSGTTTTRRR